MQSEQGAPVDPQTVFAVPGWQTPDWSQQPVGQTFSSHTHWPL
jgi:hypothetical protein